MKSSRNYSHGHGWTSGKLSPTSSRRLLPQNPMKNANHCGKFQASLMYDVRSNSQVSYRDAVLSRETAGEKTQNKGVEENEHGNNKDTQNDKDVKQKSEKPKVSFGEAASSAVCGPKRFLEVPSAYGVKGNTKWGNKGQEGVGRGGSLQVPSGGKTQQDVSGGRSSGGIGRWTLIHHSPSPTASGRTCQSTGSQAKVEQNKESSYSSTRNVVKDLAREVAKGVAQSSTGDSENSSSKCAARDLVSHSEKDSPRDFVRDPGRYPTRYPAKISAEDSVKNPGRYPVRNPLTDPARNPARDSTQDSVRNPIIHPGRYPVRNSERVSAKYSATYPVRNPANDSAKDSVRDTARDPARDPAKNPTRDPARDPTRDPARGSTGESVKESGKQPCRSVADGSQGGESQRSGGLMAIVEKFKKDQKTSRNVVSLQQQLYQETQARRVATEGSPAAACLLGDIDTFHAPFDPVICSSPKASPCRNSAGFRKTPGACRPGCRSSNTSPGFGVNGGSGLLRLGPNVGHSGQFGFVASVGGFTEYGGSGPTSRSASPVTSLFDPPRNAEGGAVGGAGPGKGGPSSAVEVMVSNLDYNISGGEWKNILYSEFHQHITILDIRVQTQLDNTSVAIISVPHIDDARFTISQFHRKKIGYKRIHVSLLNPDSDGNPPDVRSEVINILKEVVGCTMPLFMFIELYEKRYHRSITVSELYRMRDTLDVLDQGGVTAGRVVVLTPTLHQNPPAQPSDPEKMPEVTESPTCRIHCPEGSTAYMDAFGSNGLPDVILNLRSFGPHLHTLLQTHNGSMPFLSFLSCYANEFTPIEPVPEGGVSLEHLITCVPGVMITLSKFGVKKIQWCENKTSLFDESSGRLCSSPITQMQLHQFSREVVDVLKNCVMCRMPFDRFIPSYHHHHGRQCRVADYGYTKLMELLDAVPHVVQIVGDGSHKMITLTHRSQVKRFILDVRRVLKIQASKQLTLLDLPMAYSKVMGKQFDIIEYGVCYVEDILGEIPESSLIVCGSGEDTVISIPRRDQTPEEMERTKEFAVEVIDLLKHSPQYSMSFNKFIPAYHHHFGKQCRVSDYGFTKLIELFEAIPHVLKIDEEREDKTLSLMGPELLQVVGEQVGNLLQSLPTHAIPVGEFLAAFMRHYGFGLRLADFSVNCVAELMEKLPLITKVQYEAGEHVVTLADRSRTQQLTDQVLWLLMDKSEDGSLRVDQLCALYQRVFNVSLNIDDVCTHLRGVVQVSSRGPQGMVKLCPIEMFARDTRTLLQLHGGQLALEHFETAYAQHFGVALVPASYGFPNTLALLRAISHVAVTRGRGYRRIVVLCRQFEGVLSPTKPQRSEGLQRSECMQGAGFTQMAELTTSPTENSLDVKETTKASTPSSDSGIVEPHSLVEPRDDDEKDQSTMTARRRLPYEVLDHQAVHTQQTSLDASTSTATTVTATNQPCSLPSADHFIYTDGQAVPWSTIEDSGQDLVEDSGQAGSHCSASLQFAASMLPTDIRCPPHTPSTVHLDSGHDGVNQLNDCGTSDCQLLADHNLIGGSYGDGDQRLVTSRNDCPVDQTDYLWLTDECSGSVFPCVLKQEDSWQCPQPPHSWLEPQPAPKGHIQLMTPDMFLQSSSSSQWEQGPSLPSASVAPDRMVNYLTTKEHDSSTSSYMQTSPRKCRIAARFNIPLSTSPMSASCHND